MSSFTFVIAEAILNKDNNMFLDMNPFYNVVFKENKIESEKAFGGGRNPKWAEEHKLESEDGTGIATFYICNDGEMLGEVDIDFGSMMKLDWDGHWYDLKDGNGKFHLRVKDVETPEEEKPAEAEETEKKPTQISVTVNIPQ